MKTKTSGNIRLHRMAEIKNVTQLDDKPNTLYIEGYASFYKDNLGTKQVDRDNEIVNIDGLDISNFLRNPVLLWNHDWSEVRGKVLSVNKDANGLYVKAEMQRLTGKEADFENVLHGNVKSFSIGFIPYEYEYLEDALEITESELIELSIAPVQSNRSALFQVVGTKSMDLDSKGLKGLLEPKEKEPNLDKIVKSADTATTEPKVEVTPDTVVEPKVEPKVEEVKSEPKVEPKVEVKHDIDVALLAQEMIKAQQLVDEAKAAKDKADSDAKIKAEEDLKADAVNREKIALDFIRERTEAISKMTPEELNDNAETLNDYVDLVTASNETIHAKVQEFVAAMQGAPQE